MNELYHHGIKGMRWGVRRYQRKDGSLTSAGKKRYSDDNPDEKKSEESKKRGLSKKQKTAITVGAAVVATALVSYGSYRLVKSGKLDGVINSGKSKLDSIFSNKKNRSQTVQGLIDDGTIDGFKKIKTTESITDSLSKVNPTKAHNNCYNCVVATIGRWCGLDITAKGDTQGGKGMSFDGLCKAVGLDPDNETHVRRVMNPSVDKISNVITKRYKEGDCGAIGLSWNERYKKMVGATGDSGHTLNWIVKNGKVEFMDGQTNISGDQLRNIMSSFLDSGKEASIARFANVDEGLSIASDILNKFAN